MGRSFNIGGLQVSNGMEGLVAGARSAWEWVLGRSDREHRAIETTRHGPRDAVLVLDASGSMKSTDWQPTRLGGAKEAARAYVEQLMELEPSARVAVIAYGTSAETCCDLTTLERVTDIFCAIERLNYRGRTNMRAALKLALRVLRGGTRPKQVIFLTDGLNTERNPEDIASKLRQIATVNCVGIGDRAEIDEEMLRCIASPRPDGRPCYRWIGNDPTELIDHFRKLAGRISRD
jgi:uncharacterized protein YegL